MNKFKKIKFESDKKSLLIYFNPHKKRYIKSNNKRKSKFKSNIIFSIITITINMIAIISIIYLFKSKNNINKDLNFNIIEPYIKSQKDFCQNSDKYINEKYEKELVLFDVKINELKYQLYIFNSSNFLFYNLKKKGAFETTISNNIIKALKFYSEKKNITNNKDIFMLDIGGNVGWYPSLLGRYGYSILTFEASEKNSYVLKKNFCNLIKNSNVVIISKGLGSEEKNCSYFIEKHNAGNGMVICDNSKEKLNNEYLKKIYKKENEIEITTLNSFMPYLSNKNIALMKIDVEGHEFQILQGGKELITKYHIPYVVLELTPELLKEVGSDPKDLVQFFVDNGYNISLDGFLSKNYITVDKLLYKARRQANCYFIHNSMV